MWKYFLVFSSRNLLRFRSTALLQLGSIVLGLGAFIPVALVIWYHISFDSYHTRSKSIFRLSTEITLPSSNSVYAATSKTLAPLITEQLSQVKKVVRCRFMPAGISVEGKSLGESLPLFADAAFFEVFSFEEVSGNVQQALQHPDGLVITASTAERLFGSGDPLDRIVSVATPAGDFLLQVRAVIRDYPENVSFRFEMLTNFGLIEPTMQDNHGALVPGLFTYLKAPGVSSGDLNEALAAMVSSHFPEGMRNVISLQAVPFKEIHYLADHQFDSGQKGSKMNNFALGALALFLLLTTIANYINLTTALYIRRKKELTVRRLMGEGHWNQYLQLLSESALTISFAIFLTAAGSFFLVPWAESVTGMGLRVGTFSGVGFYVALLCLGFLVAGIAGVLSLLGVAKATASGTGRIGIGAAEGRRVRYALMGLQLTVSLAFAMMAMGMEDQLRFIRSRDLGFQKNNVLTLGLNTEINDKAELIKQQFEQLPFVRAVSISMTGISGDQYRTHFGLANDSIGASHLMNANYVDHNFLKVYEVKLLAGRGFDESFASDEVSAFMLNQRAIELLGFGSPEAAVGKLLRKEIRDGVQEGRIIGVVDNYHFLPLYREIEPIVWQIEPSAPKNLLAISLEKGDPEAQIASLKSALQQLGVVQTPEFVWLFDTLERAYADDRRLSFFIRLSTFVIGTVALIGVFSLGAFFLESRIKEMGIRKLLGAGVSHIFWQLGSPFAGCLAIGSLAGGAVAYFFLRSWLGQFAYHLEPSWWYLPLAAAGLALLMFTTIARHVRKAAETNPADVLRHE